MTNADELQLRSHRFFAEERLTASVLNQSADAERQRRWLHNKLLHGFGISFGLEVTRGGGDTSVVVGKGHAIDGEGRDLVVDELCLVQVPAASTGDFDLVCEWSDSNRETSTSTCGATGETLRHEIPVIRFVEIGTGTSGVLLATATISECKLKSLTFGVRRPLVAAPVPYVNAGQYLPPPDKWTELKVAGVTVGLSITVDTSSAGFFGNVSYSARVMGKRWLDPWTRVLCLDTYVIAARPEGFDLGIIILADDVKANSFTPLSLADFLTKESITAATEIPGALGWKIAWMGVEGTQ